MTPNPKLVKVEAVRSFEDKTPWRGNWVRSVPGPASFYVTALDTTPKATRHALAVFRDIQAKAGPRDMVTLIGRGGKSPARKGA